MSQKITIGFSSLNAGTKKKRFNDFTLKRFMRSAGGRTRTDMELPPRDFESRASTSFTTPASCT